MANIYMRLKRNLLRALILIVSAASTLAPFSAHSATFDYNEVFGGNQLRRPSPISPIPRSGLPAGLTSTMLAAQKAFNSSEFEEAEQFSRRITVVAPNAAEGWHILGMSLANLERYDESLVALAKAGELYKNNADPFVVSGDMLLHLDRREDAKLAYKAAVERDPTDWRAPEVLGSLAEQDGDFEAAKEYYLQVVANAPADRLFPRLRIADILIAAGTPEIAVPVLGQFVAANPEDVQGHVALAHAQLKNRETKEAVASFATASRLAPQSSGLMLHLAKAQRLDGSMDDATRTFEKARDTFPEEIDTHIELGNHYGALRDYSAAKDVFEQALTRFPESDALLRGSRLVNQRLGNLDEALAAAKNLAERDDATPGDLFALGSLAEKSNQPELARETYTKLVESDETAWIAANNLAALITDSDPERAVEYASMAAKQAPDQTDVQDTLGWALYKSGDLIAAREIYDRIATGEGAKATYLYHLGLVMIDQGDETGGQEKLRAALALDPDFSYADDAREMISN